MRPALSPDFRYFLVFGGIEQPWLAQHGVQRLPPASVFLASSGSFARSRREALRVQEPPFWGMGWGN